MKIILCLLFPALFFNAAFSQSNEEAKKLMYYERFTGASQMLKTLLNQNVQNSEAWYLLTRCYLSDNQTGSVTDIPGPMPKGLENSPWIEVARGDYMIKKGKRDSAFNYFQSALQQSNGKDPEILAAIAIAHIRSDSGDARYAISLLNKAIKKDKKNAAYYVELGNAFRKLMNGTEAYKAFNNALEINPGYAEADYRLGNLFITQNNPDMYLKYFYQATNTDPLYAPAWYALYYHYYFRDPKEAIVFLEKYINCSDSNPENRYRMTDLLYLSKQYNRAIDSARFLIGSNDSTSDPRLYKLLAYSYHALNDSLNALNSMRIYFHRQQDSLIILPDLELMSGLYDQFPDKTDSAAFWLTKAVSMEPDSAKRITYYKVIAGFYKKAKNYRQQAYWLGRYYLSNPHAGNVDLFNWGISAYMANEYKSADTIFKLYIEKYPEQTFGYYWRARADAAIDTAMEYGLAVPAYDTLIALSLKDSVHQNKKWLIEAYGYLAAYQANTEKNYPAAIKNLEQVLELDPENVNAQKYLTILKKNNTISPMSKK